MAKANPFAFSCTQDQVYSALPPSITSHGVKLGLPVSRHSNQTREKTVIHSFLKRHLPMNRLIAKEDQSSLYTQVILCNPIRRRKFNLSKSKRKKLTSKERQETKAFKIPKENQKYDQQLALHNTWKQYMEELIPSNRLTSPGEAKAACQKVLKAELQGSILTVQRSKCPSYVGTSGIVLKETRHTFTFITKDDTVKCVPKMNSIFAMEWGGHVFTLHGNQLKVRAGERSSKSFKSKPTLDL